MKWDIYFLNLAREAASKSKDPSTKTGAVIVRPDNTVASIGFNGFPIGMIDSPDRYANREEKYARIVHCEMNALIFAREAVKGYTLYTWPFCSCDRCAIHMLQAGIKKFVFPEASVDALTRWADSLYRAQSYMNELGAEYRVIPVKEL